MTGARGDDDFVAVRALFEACVDASAEIRERLLLDAPEPVAGSVRELLSIADREARAAAAPSWTRVADARGRALVLRDDGSTRALKLMRLSEGRAASFELAATRLRDPRLVQRVPGAVPWIAAGFDAEQSVGWFVTPWIDAARALPDALARADAVARARLGAALGAALSAALAAGLPAPVPGPRQVLVTPDGELRLVDLGVSAAFAVDPEVGGRDGVTVAVQELSRAFGLEPAEDVAALAARLRVPV